MHPVTIPGVSSGGFDAMAAAVASGASGGAILAWSGDPVVTGGTGAPLVVASVQFTKIPFSRGLSIGRVVANLGTKATGSLTHSYAGVATSTGALVGMTADQSSVWDSTGTNGYKPMTLVGGPFAVAPLGANDFLFGLLYVGTSSLITPKFASFAGNSSNSEVNFGSVAALSRSGAIAVADTATPFVGLVPSSMAQSAQVYFMGVS
jgi:hypothetical protein